MPALKCPYCGEVAQVRDSAVIYGRSYGPVYICPNYPECDAYVGVHPGTLTPLGTLANEELRSWRKKAHDVFDPLWKSGKMRRSKAYKWLRNTLHLSKNDGHIGMFTVEQCRQLIEAAERKKNELEGY
jgi:hypothetical protein